MAVIAQAYLETREGSSVDRVIADPAMNQHYLNRCRELGATGTDFDLNWRLMNARKRSYLSEIPKTKRYTASGIDDFEFSSEIALVHVKHQADKDRGQVITLDKILCDPELAMLFDEIAEKLAPGHSRLNYRWAALKVRKAAGRDFTMAKSAKLPTFDRIGNTKSIRLGRIPTEQGIYLFQSADDSIFVSHTDNLRHRVERHFESSDSKGLPDWLYDSKQKGIELGIIPTPTISSAERKRIELKAVAKLEPLLNVPAGAKSRKADER